MNTPCSLAEPIFGHLSEAADCIIKDMEYLNSYSVTGITCFYLDPLNPNEIIVSRINLVMVQSILARITDDSSIT